MFQWTVYYSMFIRGGLVDKTCKVKAWTRKGAKTQWELYCAEQQRFGYFNRAKRGSNEANRSKAS